MRKRFLREISLKTCVCLAALWVYSSASYGQCTPISSFPWTEGFEGLGSVGQGVFPSCWSTVNEAGFDAPGTDNGTRVATVYGGPHSGTKFQYSQWDNTAWVFTPPMQLTAGTSYDFSFYMENKDVTSPVDFLMDVSYGDTNTAAGMVNSLQASYTCSNTSYQQFLYTFTPATSGVKVYRVHLRLLIPGT
jgi:hypothetical protein